MGWITYYKLLEKYNGDITQATEQEREFAARVNPNTPADALEVARRKWEAENDGN